MTVLDALGTFIAANGGGTLGTNLFLSRMPDSPDACVAVFEYGGAQPDYSFGASADIIRAPRVQVMVRGAREDYPGARALSVTIRDALEGVVNQTLSTIEVLRVVPIIEPEPIGNDDLGRPQFTTNYTVMYLA